MYESYLSPQNISMHRKPCIKTSTRANVRSIRKRANFLEIGQNSQFLQISNPKPKSKLGINQQGSNSERGFLKCSIDLRKMNLGDLNKVWEIKTLKRKDREDEARKILEKIAIQVQPIMRNHRWRVKILSEFWYFARLLIVPSLVVIFCLVAEKMVANQAVQCLDSEKVF